MTSEAPRCVGSAAHQQFTIANTNLYNEDDYFMIALENPNVNELDDTVTFIPYGTSAVVDIVLPSLLTAGTSYNAYAAAATEPGAAGWVDFLGGTATRPGMFVALSPARVLDTRGTKVVSADGGRVLSMFGTGGVPATGVSAVVINTTVTETQAAGYLTVFPGWGIPPLASNLNWSRPATTIPNLVTVRVPWDGIIQFFNGSNGTTQVVADVAGYYIGA